MGLIHNLELQLPEPINYCLTRCFWSKREQNFKFQYTNKSTFSAESAFVIEVVFRESINLYE